MNHVCNICNKVYKTSKSLWNHNHKYHDKPNDKHDKHYDKHYDKHDKLSNLKSYECEICNKVFKHYQSRWRHLQLCEEQKTENNKNQNEIEIIKKEIENLKKKSFGNTTIKNITNNGIINFSMNKTGFESLEILSGKEIEYILNQEMNSIISLIEFLNFNDAHPENHTFCTTALNDKYVNTMNTETFAIEKQRKTDFYDNLIHRGINNMKLLFERLKIMKIKKISNYEDKIKQLIDFLVVNKKGKKACVELINVLSFNKRHITQSTWLDIIQGITPVKSEIINSNKDVNTINITEKTSKSKFLLKHDSDSDEDSDHEIIYPKIDYKGQTYLLDGCELFTISSNGKKLNLFGTFINGRVKKNKEFDL